MSAKNDSVLKTFTVALLVCLVCAVVVATAAVMLRPVQEINKLLDKQVNILMAAGLYSEGMDVAQAFESIDRRFVDLESGEYVDMPESYDQRRAAKDPEASVRLDGKVDIASIRNQAKVAEVYLAKDEDGELSKIILPIHGYGLWSTLYGFLALQPDANTIAGLGFYEHAETPGLGGEVDNPKWKGLWPGKTLFNEEGELAIAVVKGTVDSGAPDAQHKVDGLAGATLTTNGVNNLVRFWMGENGFGPYLDSLNAQAAAEQMPVEEPVEDEEVSNG
ncbi:Na(+)-translocating NADH-quinone reductase subunit C [Alcanivorax sp. 1008]|uniref:Na(+)-translocating NADH-quinone reductase subunit C n=1 Tax=Alcanivorax sp. 1008 TaxID=2816853 RepID=UPI001DC0C795|nr:Na(+)-translocating NADH-quinone reductase subunit C [Alcanivorax sp. 1008]MCC1496285.1 Na(+)-translocating NADH-quinone reductase subunit C [Alcanivorax sp. 1008]